MSRILVPLQILEGQTLDPGIIQLLADDEVVLLGFHQIPEQTAPEQARESFGDRATAALDDVEDALVAAGASVERRLVFTHDREQTRRRVAEETDIDAMLFSGPAMDIDRLLVVVHPDAAAAVIADFVVAQVADTDRDVVLLSLTESADGASEALELVEERLAEAGISGSRVTTRQRVTDNHIDAIVAAAQDTDAVVIGRREPSTMALLLGEFVDRVRTETVGPVLVVETPPLESGADET